MFSPNLKEGTTVHLTKIVHLPNGDSQFQHMSTHKVTKLLKSRMYVSDLYDHFHFPGGGLAGNGWSIFLTENKAEVNYSQEKEAEYERIKYKRIIDIVNSLING